MRKEREHGGVSGLLMYSGEAIECLIYQGKMATLAPIGERIEELIKLWSDKDPKIEWGCILYGDYTTTGKELVRLVTGFVELPAWNLNRENSLSINLDDITRIAQDYNALALLHSHPSGNLFPTAQDMATFLYCDILLGKSLLYIIASPDGEKLILSFERCHACENSFFKTMEFVRRGSFRASGPSRVKSGEVR